MKALKILFVVILVAITQGCTRNDGNIGPIWGMWRVTNLEINGEPKDDYNGTLYFSFQASVFMQKVVNEENHTGNNTYAMWMYQGDDLLINFTEDRYKPHAVSGMIHGENFVKVLMFEGNDMHLEYVNPDGVTYFYKLKRW